MDTEFSDGLAQNEEQRAVKVQEKVQGETVRLQKMDNNQMVGHV
ncbi:hypothetical protein [Phyllobacterium lublinensis]|nr:hypothetical protein [Phyllobacterium sp. 2063]